MLLVWLQFKQVNKKWCFETTGYLGVCSQWLSGKESSCQSIRLRRHGFSLWVRKIPSKRKQQPPPVFLPGKPMNRGAWWARVHGVSKSQVQLSKWAWRSTSVCNVINDTKDILLSSGLKYNKIFKSFSKHK